MCGICGILEKNGTKVDQHLLKTMNNAIAHRGPDDAGYYIDTSIGLAMRRLSIIDLETGHQPIHNEDETIWIVFNGEIYNYQTLRRNLESKGHEFMTRSDTEVILHLYEEMGDECISQLNGMFAFAIWDSNMKRLFLARDRLGIKPLHYAERDGTFLFGSEIKSILQDPRLPRNVNKHALQEYLGFEYVPGSETMFEGIFKLLPGCTLTVEKGQTTVKRYWDLRYPSTCTLPEDAIANELYERLKKSITMRLMSDVPLGAFLSGGIDSSSIVGMMSQATDRTIQTFSIGFDDVSYNELEYAQKVATLFNTEHHERIITPDVTELVRTALQYLDEPLADVSIFPTYLISREATSKVKVVLSGDGGDELFAGYDWYRASRADAVAYQHIPRMIKNAIKGIADIVPATSKKKGTINEFKRFVEGASLPSELHHLRWQYFITENERIALLSEPMRETGSCDIPPNPVNEYYARNSAPNSLAREQYVDLKMYLPDDILTKVDRMSMACSLEARVPFLDYTLVEFAATIPSYLKLRGTLTKYILKKAMGRLLPRDILYRKKQGFSIPMKNWLRDELQDFMLDTLSSKRICEMGFFNPDYIEKITRQHLEGRRNNAHQIWSLMLFNLWHARYITKEEPI